MTTSLETRPPVKRFVALVDVNVVTGEFLLEIVQRTEATYYIAREIPSDFGVAFQLHKQALDTEEPVETYSINLESLQGPFQCDCRGFPVARAGACKHVLSLVALIRAGRLVPQLPQCFPPTRDAMTWGDPSAADYPVPGTDDR